MMEDKSNNNEDSFSGRSEAEEDEEANKDEEADEGKKEEAWGHRGPLYLDRSM